MRVWTATIRRRELAKRQTGSLLVDVTQMTGDKRLAPEWHDIMSYKNGRISWELFTERYEKLMRKRFIEMEYFYIDLCQNERITILCYCKSKKHCHRHLLAKLLKEFCLEHGIDFTFGGEVR